MTGEDLRLNMCFRFKKMARIAQQQTNPADVNHLDHLIDVSCLRCILLNTPGLYVRNDTDLVAKVSRFCAMFLRR